MKAFILKVEFYNTESIEQFEQHAATFDNNDVVFIREGMAGILCLSPYFDDESLFIKDGKDIAVIGSNMNECAMNEGDWTVLASKGITRYLPDEE